MTNDKAPDNATGDSVTNAELITRAHAFMAALLTFLGFNVLPTETAFDMLGALTQWLADAKKIRRDPQGATARIWWDAFKLAREFDPVTSRVARAADEYTAEFGKRFLPVAEEEDRDTLNTADFDALRDELNRADAQFDEIVAALEGRTVEFQFPMPQVVAGLRAERDALLRVNAHHASEIESLRQERDALKAQLASAIVPLPKPERVEPGQRWAMTCEIAAHTTDSTTMTNSFRFATSNITQGYNWYYLGKDA